MSVEVDSAHFKLVSDMVGTVHHAHKPPELRQRGVGLGSPQCGSRGYAGYTRYLPAHTQCPLAETRTRTYPAVGSDLGPVPVRLTGYGYLPDIFHSIRIRAWC